MFGQMASVSATDLGYASLAVAVLALIKSLLEGWSRRKDVKLAADIATQERADKALLDVRIKELENKHEDCERERLHDREIHEKAAAERGTLIAGFTRQLEDLSRRIDALEITTTPRRPPKPPKSSPTHPVVPPPQTE